MIRQSIRKRSAIVGLVLVLFLSAISVQEISAQAQNPKKVEKPSASKEKDIRDDADETLEVRKNADGTKTVRITPGLAKSGGDRQDNLKPEFRAEGSVIRSIGSAAPIEISRKKNGKGGTTVGVVGKRLEVGFPVVVRSGGKKLENSEGEEIEGAVVGSNKLAFKSGARGRPQVDYEVVPEGVKELVILDERPEGTGDLTVVSSLKLDGLAVAQSEIGEISYTDSTGKTVFLTPPAFAFDSRAGANTPGNAYTSLNQQVSGSGSKMELRIVVPGEWLDHADRVYPVTIDPTVIVQTWNAMNLGYQPWGDNSGGATFSASTNDMLFGNWFGSEWKSYTQFNPALFSNVNITKATLHLWVQDCGSATAGLEYSNPIRVRRLTSGYWFGQSWPGPTSTGEVQLFVSGSSRHATADITQLIKPWENASTNLGLGFDMGAVSDSYCRAQRTSAGGQFTSIELTYNENPPFIDNGSFEAGRAAWWPCYKPGSITYDTASWVNAYHGSTVLRARTNSDGSICQNKAWKPRAGDLYAMAVRVRSTSGTPFNGSISLWEIVDPALAPSWNTHQNFVANANWQTIVTSACARNAGAYQLKAEIYMATPNVDLDIDLVEVSIGNPSSCSGSPITTTTVPPSTTTTTTTATTLPPPNTIPPDPFFGTISLRNNFRNECLVSNGLNAAVGIGPCAGQNAQIQFVRNGGGYLVQMGGGCLAVDYYHRDSNVLLPSADAAAAIWLQECTGGGHQWWTPREMSLNEPGRWFRVEPATWQPYIGGLGFLPCLNANSSPQATYAVIEYTCVGAAREELWTPQGSAPQPPPTPTAQQLQDGRITPIHVLDEDKCIGTVGATIQIVTGGKCESFTPRLVPGGYLLETHNDRCLGTDGSGLRWEQCGTAAIWSDTWNSYPDQRKRFPLLTDILVGGSWVPRCLTRTSNSLSLQTCGISAGQEWIDDHILVISDGLYDFQTTDGSGKVIGDIPDYAPSVLGDRIFWCSNMGGDKIFSARMGEKPVEKREYTVPGTFRYGRSMLTCDPHPVKVPGGYRVYLSVGSHHTGFNNCNNIAYVKMDDNGKVEEESFSKNITYRGQTIQVTWHNAKLWYLHNDTCPQATNPAEYGWGQPNVFDTPSGNQLIAMTKAYAVSEEIEVRRLLNPDSMSAPIPLEKSDGTVLSLETTRQPDFFQVNGQNFIYRLLAQNGETRLRRYSYIAPSTQFPDGKLVRDTASETYEPAAPPQTGPDFNNGFLTKTNFAPTKWKDGSGVERAIDGRVTPVGGRLSFWIGVEKDPIPGLALVLSRIERKSIAFPY